MIRAVIWPMLKAGRLCFPRPTQEMALTSTKGWGTPIPGPPSQGLRNRDFLSGQRSYDTCRAEALVPEADKRIYLGSQPTSVPTCPLHVHSLLSNTKSHKEGRRLTPEELLPASLGKAKGLLTGDTARSSHTTPPLLCLSLHDACLLVCSFCFSESEFHCVAQLALFSWSSCFCLLRTPVPS